LRSLNSLKCAAAFYGYMQDWVASIVFLNLAGWL